MTSDEVRQLFDCTAGELRWRQRLSKRAKIGMLAGAIREDGVRIVRVRGKNYYAHRLAFLHRHGRWPEKGEGRG